MHIEPGLVSGAKIVLSYATAVGAAGYTLKLAADTVRQQGVVSTAVRAAISAAAVFCFFQVLPHFRVGVSEVHFILGSTLFLLFGAAPAAIGLAAGLALQGLFFVPEDLPQYGMNVTTILVPLFAVRALAERLVAPGTPYVELTYVQALKLSTAYQAGVVGWVAFWALYGAGFSVENMVSISTFGAAYMTVVLIEPLVDLAVLAGAKGIRALNGSGLVTARLYNAA